MQLLHTAATWYADGTFKVVRKPFLQLFTIHSFIRQEESIKQVPLVFVLMSSRKKKDYRKVLTAVLELLPSVPRCRRIVIDFERALWRAFQSLMPQCELKGCVFYWNQAVWRRVRDSQLKRQYMTDHDTHSYIRKLMALLFLPAVLITTIFDELKVSAVTQPLVELCAYIQDTWIENTLWTPTSWSVYNMSIRTNNDVEGWHRRLNTTGREHMPLYRLVSVMKAEALTVQMQVRLVSENKLQRYQRREYKDLQGRLFTAWDKFRSGESSAMQLLRTCSRVYGPTGVSS